MKAQWLLICLFILGQITTLRAADDSDANHPWIFFDMGDTIVDTKSNEDPITHDFKKIFYLPHALASLRSLKSQGYQFGMLVTVQESWGKSQEGK